MPSVSTISPQDLKARLDAGDKPFLLDVREPWEVALAALPGAVNIPLNEIPQRLNELDPASDIVVLCKVGGRSQRAAEFLARSNFAHVTNLAGGINAWSRDVDPGVPEY
jgi:sulfur-carrier protein adenylyltransferase/sulfurtransferase